MSRVARLVYAVCAVIWVAVLPTAWAGDLDSWSQFYGTIFSAMWCAERAWRVS